MNNLKKILNYIRGYGKECVLGPLFKLLEASFELLIPLVVAKIVDVGIQQGGIEQVAPEVIRESELLKLTWLMKPEEKELVMASYGKISQETLAPEVYE